MNQHFIDWIWNIRGSLALAPGQSGEDAFHRLDPLFHTTGTSHERSDDTLTFRKKNQAAQDKMAVFDGGVLQIRKDAAGAILHYRLKSRALLLCFLAPLLFLGFGQATVLVGHFEKTSAQSSEKKPEKKKDVALPQNPIDAFLGAPAPEKPKKDKAKDEDKPSPTAAYVFAALFAALYVVGRILEEKRVRSLFRGRLLDV